VAPDGTSAGGKALVAFPTAIRVSLDPAQPVKREEQMDEQIEAFLADVVAFEREDSNAIGEGVRQRLAFYETQFCAAETDKRMKGMAFRAFYALVRTRVVEEIKRCKGTSTAEHLKIVLSVIDRAR
jgi:hypothetical protein